MSINNVALTEEEDEEPKKRSFFDGDDGEDVLLEAELEPSAKTTEEAELDVISLIETSIEEQSAGALTERVSYDGEHVHALSSEWTFWFKKRMQGARTAENYAKSIKFIGNVSSVEAFWGAYSHLVRPNDLPNTSDYQLFRAGIKPVWEDEMNKRGGKWRLRLRKGWASKLWEDLLLALVGGLFADDMQVCGAIVSIRHREDSISIWNSDALNEEAKARALHTIRSVLQIPPSVYVEYKPHDATIKVPAPPAAVFDAAAEGSDHHHHHHHQQHQHQHHYHQQYSQGGYRNNNSNNNNGGNNQRNYHHQRGSNNRHRAGRFQNQNQNNGNAGQDNEWTDRSNQRWGTRW